VYAKLHVLALSSGPDTDEDGYLATHVDHDTSIAVYFDGTKTELLVFNWQKWTDDNLSFSNQIAEIVAVELTDVMGDQA